MKKLAIIFSAMAALTLSSCLDDTELTGTISDDRMQEISSQDPDKVFAASVQGMYGDMQQYVYSNLSHNYFGQKSFDYLTSLMGNDMIMTGRFGMSLYHYLLDYWQQDYAPAANRWREYYTAIDNSNKMLKLIDPNDENPSVQKYRATALAFRGYAYSQLANLYQFAYYTGAEGTKWGKGAQYDHTKDLCVPIVTENTEGDQPRSTVEEVYTQLLGDLETAYSIFEELGMVHTASPTDMDGCVVAMYLARAYMVMHEWDKALTYAQVVKNNFPVLQGEDQILQGFSSINLPDVVYGCDITADNSTVYMSWFSQMDAFSDGYAGIGVWRGAFKPLVDRIADDDIRLEWFVSDRNLQTSEAIDVLASLGKLAIYYQSIKFIGAGRENVIANGDGTGWELGDYIYLRSEEAYLMEAEILAHQNKSGDAVDALKAFMATRQPSYDYTFTDKAALLEEINYQKRVEFWGEGLEWLDNRRLNIPVDRTDATWGAANNNHFSAAKLYMEQESRPMRYQLPISEIENNQMISEDQQN